MLQNDLIKLRAIEPSEYELIRKWRTSPDVYMSFFEFNPISQKQNNDFYANASARTNEFNFCIETIKERTVIGTISLLNIDYRNRKAELGRVCIGDKNFLHKGYCSSAINLVKEYAFKNLNIRKLYCEVFNSNEKAVNLYKKCGFVQEAVLIKHIFKNGKYEDVAIYSLFNGD